MMSKPAIHRATPAPSTNGSQVTVPVTATQAPTGPMPIVIPRKRWHSHVHRLVKG